MNALLSSIYNFINQIFSKSSETKYCLNELLLAVQILINTYSMGNKISCCKANSPRITRKTNNSSTFFGSDIRNDTSSTNLQHISEREPDDIDSDPSSHPTCGPLFMQRSRSDIRSMITSSHFQIHLTILCFFQIIGKVKLM